MNYYYDDCSLNHELIELQNFKINLNNDLPNVLIYICNN